MRDLLPSYAQPPLVRTYGLPQVILWVCLASVLVDAVGLGEEDEGRETGVLGDEASLVAAAPDDPRVSVGDGLSSLASPVLARAERLFDAENPEGLLDGDGPVMGHVVERRDVAAREHEPAVGDDHEAAVVESSRRRHEHEVRGDLDGSDQHQVRVAGEASGLVGVVEVRERLAVREARGLEGTRVQHDRTERRHDYSIAKIQRSLYQAGVLYNIYNDS